MYFSTTVPTQTPNFHSQRFLNERKVRGLTDDELYEQLSTWQESRNVGM